MRRGMGSDGCFLCGRIMRSTKFLVDTRDDQTVYVGGDCYKKVVAAGERGIKVPDGGQLRLYPMKKATDVQPVGDAQKRRCGLCSKPISSGVYCAKCSRRLESGESAGSIMSKATDIAPVGDDADEVWKRDTDKGAAELIKKDGRTMTSAEIARKYGFSLSFVKEVLGGDNTRPGHPANDSAVKDFVVRVKRVGGTKITEVTIAAGDPDAAKDTAKAQGYLVYGTPRLKRFAGDIAPVGDGESDYEKWRLTQVNRTCEKCNGSGKLGGEKCGNCYGKGSYKMTVSTPIGRAKDAGSTYDVSYKLNGPIVFQVTASQFHEWARKNGVNTTNFASVLEGLKKFTGDPRIKDWEMDASVGDELKPVGDSKDYGDKPNMLSEGDKVKIDKEYGGGTGMISQVSPSGLFYVVKGKGSFHGSNLQRMG